MADANDLYNGDLYGDLDLEDLEELVEPPELDPVPQASTSQAPASTPAPAAASAATSTPAAAFGQGAPAPAQPAAGGFGGAAPQQFDAFANQQADQAGIDRIRPSDMPDEGKMFIGGLNWETTDDGLRAYMAQFGEIEASTIMRDPTGRSRGFAFLTYRDAASVTKVLAQTHHLDGKQIDPKRAIPRAEHERTAKVFVGGLAPSVTGESLRIFLTQFGAVMDATVMFDKETGRSKGFAFATFADEESVGRAMAASGIELEGKAIEIKKAQPRGAGTQPGKFTPGQQGNRFGAGGFQQTGMGSFGGNAMGGAAGGFDPNAMAMMYQNMMKNSGMGNMMTGFDPNSMAMMYQNMMKTMAAGGAAGSSTGMMGNAPAINPNMAMRNGMGMGGMGMGGMGMGMGNMMGMGGMGGMGMGGMGMGGMGGMGMGNMGMQQNRMGGSAARPVPNAPRGPAAMRNNASPAQPGGGTTPQGGSGPGAQRYSTQGSARAKPY
ncbi:hypothetical protein IAU60_001274 [Kwoniella sp. DSM 27419]